ncbi:HAMP domain-containing sensor histidine kinase [Nocardioides sp. 616]|uniref:sensor histidine kinase n=1 Tax=Nocardioides sp. 616 TaxID=2268090 RepID=UPI000DEEA3A0|nr:HAMP domain-containing sensor histidine kinase [Nocardioides sp. 616]
MRHPEHPAAPEPRPAAAADLSHRLRTPLTALRLRIDGLTDPEERMRLSADLDELEAVVEHVLRQSRRTRGDAADAACDACAVVATRARFWEPLAEDQGRGFELRVDSGTALVATAAEDLSALVDVLLDNVFTHTAEPTGFRVECRHRAGGGAMLVVADEGPGFPTGLDVVGRGTSGAGSTGLGLAIAEATAAESGGVLTVGAAVTGGARVVVELGPPG